MSGIQKKLKPIFKPKYKPKFKPKYFPLNLAPVLCRLRRRRHRGADQLPAGSADAGVAGQGVVRGVQAPGERGGQEEEEEASEGQEKSGNFY